MNEVALVAGSVAAGIFMLSQLPMLIKAGRTKELGSYSALNIVLSNVGNVIYAVYVFSLPPGPIWAMHSFYLTATALMLFWYLQHRLRLRRPPVGPAPTQNQADDSIEEPTVRTPSRRETSEPIAEANRPRFLAR